MANELGNPNVYSERHSNGFLQIWSTDLSGKDVGKDLFTTNMGWKFCIIGQLTLVQMP